ncbi:MAG: AAA family ATPase [Omnitrophica bacterium]|nr:AAA family ATPase [Candidatus Omnitrophota bacterium]
MSYYRILGLRQEPFSTSPDPAFFYQSREHTSALYRLRIAIELKRGLSLILGDVGTGKTTLSRRLAQLLRVEPNILMTMVLNPIYDTETQFLADLAERFHIIVENGNNPEPAALAYMNAIEKFLFERCVEEEKTIILLIDESQKMSGPCLEVLRSLLNYETNEYKILQVVLLGQMELLPRISRIKNLWDRIALKYVINPLEESEVKELIGFRLRRAGYVSRYPMFSDKAINAIYNYTQGYPRKITLMCHDALEHLIMSKKEIVDKELVQELIQKDVKPVGV